MPHQGLVDAVQSTFTGVDGQLLGTVLAIAALVLVVETVRRSGSWLKARFDDAVVESLQAGVTTVTTVTVGAFLVVVWHAGPQVNTVLQTLEFSRADAINVVFTVAILGVAYSLTRVTKTAIKRLSRQRGAISNHQQEVAHHVVQIGVYVVALLVVFGLWGVDPGGLLVGAGVAGVVLGLAARQTLGAVLAGFVVLFSRPFELGDWVQIDDREGVVTDITIVNTQLRTFDDEFVMIPNDVVTSTEVINRSRKGRLRLNTDVGVDYDTNVEHAMEVAAEVLTETDLVMRKPDPHVVLKEFGPSSVVLRLRYYIDNPSARKMWKARTRVVSGVHAAFADEGIKIPFPQRELSGRREAGGLRVTGDGVADGDGTDDGDDADAEEDEPDADGDADESEEDERRDVGDHGDVHVGMTARGDEEAEE
ncbi:MAG: mechanosensitive ion channel family protein [Haloarculaceae archaeon]